MQVLRFRAEVHRASCFFRFAVAAFFLVVLSANIALAQAAAPIPYGLTNWWRAENSAVDTQSGSGGVLINDAGFTPNGEAGSAFSFNGTPYSAITLGTPLANLSTSDFSIDFWVRTTSSAQQALVSQRVSCNVDSHFDVRLNYQRPNNILVELEGDQNGAEQNWQNPSATLDDGVFHHVAITRQGPTVTVYIDGVQASQLSTDAPTNIANSAPFTLGQSGCSGVDGTGWFQGAIDEVHIFNRALTATEVKSIYGAGTGGLTTLVGWWKFDEGTGIVAADSSGNGNTGMLAGSKPPAWTTDIPSVPYADLASLIFDGSTSYVNVVPNGASLNFASQISVAAWVKLSSVPTGTHGIISKPQQSEQTGWALRMEDQVPNFGLNNGIVNCSVHASNYPFEPGVWTHVAATYDASTSTVHLYVNGVDVPVDNQGCKGLLIPSSKPLYIGQELSGDDDDGDLERNFPGEIDDARVYNRILSPSEVADLAITGAPLSATVSPSATAVQAGSANPLLIVTANGGVPPYTYIWSTKATTQTISVSTATPGRFNYSVTVRDANGAQASASASVDVTSQPISLPAAPQSNITGGHNTNLVDTYVTPYTASQDGWITNWQTEFTGGPAGVPVPVPAGVQLKILRSTGNGLVVVAQGPVNDPRPLLQKRFPSYPNFNTTDSLTTFNDPPIPVQAGDFIGITIYADPQVGYYLYPMVGPAGTLQVPRNVGMGQSVLETDPATVSLPNPPALSFDEAPASTQSPLKLLKNYFVTGDFVSSGVTLRGTGVSGIATANITVPTYTQDPNQGVPEGADIVAAYLYWETLENTASPSASTGTFRGYPIIGRKIGNDISYTDGNFSGTLRVYRADVNAYLPVGSNGVRFASGTHAITLADSGGSSLPLTEGASLVVVYRVLSKNFPLKSVVIYDGSAVPTSPVVQVVRGFYDAAGLATGAGQGKSTNLFFNGGAWNTALNFVRLVQPDTYDAVLNSGAYAAVVLSTPVNNSDNDGILDAWKSGPPVPDFHAGQPGYYNVSDGSWVPLPGAQHGEKDLFVQLDYMCGAVLSNGSCDPAKENHFPSPDANGNNPLAMVQQAFAAHGVALHIQIGNAVPEDTCIDNLSTNPPQLCQYPNQPGVVGWKNSLEFIKLWPRNLAACLTGGDCTPRFPFGQKDSYHYVLFGHSLAIPAWNSRFGSLVSISVANGVTTIVTTDRGTGINACPSRVTISGVLGNPSLNGVYNSTGCADTKTITVATPGVPNWSYPNNNLPEPLIGITSGTVTSISGYSDLGGSDSAITLGLWETDPSQDMSKRANVEAGTLMHEIGHTIGLSHGGLYYDNPNNYIPNFEANCKPNYQSVMNYLFQLDLLGPTHTLDFSGQTLTTLNESTAASVTQFADITNAGAAIPTSAWYVPFTSGDLASPATRHCDGTPLAGDAAYRVDDPVAPITPAWSNGQDINFDGQLNGQMRGYNDWANMDLRQVGATAGEYADWANVLSFGPLTAPLNIGAGGNVTLGSGGTVTLGSGGTVTLGSGGNVTLGSAGTIALGSGGNVTLNSGGTVTLGSAGTVAPGSGGTIALGSGGTIALGSGGTIAFGSGGIVTVPFAGTVTLGSGGTITLGSGGTVTLGSGGSYTLDGNGGTITLGSGGNVTLGSGGNVTLGSGGIITPGSGGTIALGSGGTVTLGSGGNVTLGSGGTIALGSGGNVTLGSGGIIAMGSGGTITMGSGGNVTLGSGGTVTLGSGGNVALGSGGNVTLGSGGTVTLGSGGTVTLGSGGTVTLGSGGNVTLGSGGTITMGSGGNVTLGSGGTVTLGSGGAITQGGSTTTVGPGTYTISSGGIIALGSGGNVTLGSGGNVTLGSGGNITLGSGGTITLGSGGTITMGSGGNVTLGSGGNVTLGSGGNVTLGSGGNIALGSGGNVTLGSGGNIVLGSGGNVTLGSGGSLTDELNYDTANSVVRPPSSPTETPTPIGVRIDWTAPSFGVVATYTVYRSSDGGVPVPIGSISGINGNAPATSFLDSNPDTTAKTVVYTVSTAIVPDQTSTQERTSPLSQPAVLKNDQTIALGPLPSSVKLGDPQPTVTATSMSSGVPDNLQVNFNATGACSVVAGSQTITNGVSSATLSISATGTCNIVASQGGSNNYNAANSVSGAFLVLPAGSSTQAQTITFAALQDVQYGTHFALSATSSVGLTVSFSTSGPCTTSGTTTGVGVCTVTASAPAGTVAGVTYSAATVTQSFNIYPASLTVAANNLSLVYGQTIPALTYTITGFVNGDAASVVSGTPLLTTTAKTGNPVGVYPITVSTGSLSAANYSFLYVNGKVTIAPANTATMLTSSTPNPSDYDVPVTFTATVSAQSPSLAYVNEGVVAFYSDASTTPICTAVPINNVASCQTATPLPVSSSGHVITAAYTDPAGNFSGSPSSTQITQVVNLRQTTVTVTFSPAGTVPIYTNTTIKVTVADTDANGTPIIPTGTITLQSTESSDDFSATTCTLDNTGSCSVTLVPVVPNGRFITASYAGDAFHAASDNQSSTTKTNLMVTAAVSTNKVCLTAPFNGISIPAGSYIWFNSAFKPRGDDDKRLRTPVHITFYNQTVTIGNRGTINLPDAEITVDPLANFATTTFDSVNNLWLTTVSAGDDDDDRIWLGGAAYEVPAGGLPGGDKVTWCGYFASDTTHLHLGWQWSAAAYSSFSTDYNALGVKAMDDDDKCSSRNKDNAGTPENFKQFLIPGARGGGKNYTGSSSGSLDPLGKE